MLKWTIILCNKLAEKEFPMMIIFSDENFPQWYEFPIKLSTITVKGAYYCNLKVVGSVHVTNQKYVSFNQFILKKELLKYNINKMIN